MPYTLLMVKGHRLDNKPIRDMTRTQILAYINAYRIESKTNEDAMKGKR